MGVIIRNSLKTTIINYIGIIIGAISVLFIQTIAFTESQIGEIRLIMDKAILIMPFILIGMGSVASRFYFHFDKDAGTLTGSDTGFVIGIGQRVTVRLAEAAPVTGGLTLELLTVEDKAPPRGGFRPGTSPRRKSSKARHKAAKSQKKATRRRK